MGSMSIYHWVILGIVVLVLFGGGGKISSLMGDFAKGIKSFKKSMSEDDAPSAPPPHVVPPSVSHTESEASGASRQDARMAEEDHTHTHGPS